MVSAVAAALLLAGCAEAGTSVNPGSAGSAGSAGSTGTSVNPGSAGSAGSTAPGGEVLPTNVVPISPGEPTQVSPAHIDASAVPGGYSGPMTLDVTGTWLTVTGTEGSCSRASAELLGQDARSVSVRLVLTRTGDGICTAIARVVPLTVQLAKPLGTRTVVLSEVRR